MVFDGCSIMLVINNHCIHHRNIDTIDINHTKYKKHGEILQQRKHLWAPESTFFKSSSWLWWFSLSFSLQSVWFAWLIQLSLFHHVVVQEHYMKWYLHARFQRVNLWMLVVCAYIMCMYTDMQYLYRFAYVYTRKHGTKWHLQNVDHGKSRRNAGRTHFLLVSLTRIGLEYLASRGSWEASLPVDLEPWMQWWRRFINSRRACQSVDHFAWGLTVAPSLTKAHSWEKTCSCWRCWGSGLNPATVLPKMDQITTVHYHSNEWLGSWLSIRSWAVLGSGPKDATFQH